MKPKEPTTLTTAIAVFLTALTGCALLIWTSRHLEIARHRRQSFVLTETYGLSDGEAVGASAGDDDPPRLSVVVAAKDEQENIEACVDSMLRQDYPNFEMIVVNDRSSDRTAAIAERLAASDPRLRLINVEHLPPGWCGKNHAMQTGIAAADGEWLCMTDADCRQQSTRTLSVAVAYARRTGTDLLSVLPNLQMRGFWENVVQPVCGGIMMIWFHPDKVNDPAKPHAYANGAFMLMRREAYQRIGTHEAVKDRVNEDMHMAARVKSAGMKLRTVRNEHLYSVRMYSSLGEIVRGWSRIFYGTFGTLKRLSLSLAVLVVMGLLPYGAAAFGLVAAAAGTEPRTPLLACGLVGLAAVAMQISVIVRFYGLIRARPALAWTYALGCAVAGVALVAALGKLRRGATVTWRDTTYARRPDR